MPKTETRRFSNVVPQNPATGDGTFPMDMIVNIDIVIFDYEIFEEDEGTKMIFKCEHPAHDGFIFVRTYSEYVQERIVWAKENKKLPLIGCIKRVGRAYSIS